MATMTTEVPEQIASLLIPMLGRPLLVPNVTVAEIVNWREVTPAPDSDSPAWLLGDASWRGTRLPVISVERMNNPAAEDAEIGQRLVVINSQRPLNIPFYGICVQGIPRLVRVFPEELGELDTDLSAEDAYDMMVMVSGERAVIPALDVIESHLDQHFS